MSIDTRPLELPLAGGCQCGALRYSVIAAPLTLYCCHCTECRRQASSAFGMSLRVSSGSVELAGPWLGYERDPGSGTRVEGVFCPTCGSRVIHRGRGDDSGVSIKAGSLDKAPDFEPVGHIWTRSALPWMRFAPDALLYETQPDDGYAALNEAFARRYSFA